MRQCCFGSIGLCACCFHRHFTPRIICSIRSWLAPGTRAGITLIGSLRRRTTMARRSMCSTEPSVIRRTHSCCWFTVFRIPALTFTSWYPIVGRLLHSHTGFPRVRLFRQTLGRLFLHVRGQCQTAGLLCPGNCRV